MRKHIAWTMMALTSCTAKVLFSNKKATTTCAETQQQSTKSNATTQGKCTLETHNKNSKPECNNTSMKSKS